MNTPDSASGGAAETTETSDPAAELLREECWALARNLWWSWHQDATSLFRDLDPVAWRAFEHNPIALLSGMSPAQFATRVATLSLHGRIHAAYERLQQYMSETPLWAGTHTGTLRWRPVAYFSWEFGLHESLPVYFGRLAVLAGDHLKTASDMGVPMVGVGLFGPQARVRQSLDHLGWQREEYWHLDPGVLPLEPARGADGNPLLLNIPTRLGKLYAKRRGCFRYHVER
jgi:starch phosphorylase